jgi:hypothetical protein
VHHEIALISTIAVGLLYALIGGNFASRLLSGESDPSFPSREAELELLIKLIDEATAVQAQEQLRAFYGPADISMW